MLTTKITIGTFLNFLICNRCFNIDLLYYRYYRRKGTKVDIRFVLLTSITVISLIQYFVKKQKYESAIKYFVTVPKYRNKALEMISQDKNYLDIKKDTKNRKINKMEAKEQQEKVIRQVRSDNNS